MQLNFPPYGDTQDIFNGRQALSCLPTISNPGIRLHFTQHMQHPQQHSVCPVVVSGSRPLTLTHAVIPQPPPHQTTMSPYAATLMVPHSGSTDHSQLLAVGEYRPLTGK